MWIVTKEAVIGLVRTGVAYVWVWLLTAFPMVREFLVDVGVLEAADELVSGGFVIIVGTALYAVIRWAAEKWGWIGYLLIFNTKPAYAEVDEAA